MPGPGGGSRGGGFRGGGGSSGGFRGGSPGGGFRPSPGGFRPGGFGPQPHRHFRSPMGFGYRRPMGCSSILILPMVFIFLVLFLMLSFSGGSTPEGEAITSGGRTYVYDEEAFQEFADREYQQAFGGSDNYEGNILLAILTNDEADDYFAIAWVGDDIDPEIRNMFGGYTDLGTAMNQYVNGTYYAYSLDGDLAVVVETMTAKVSAVSDGKLLSQSDVGFRNYTDLDLSEETVNEALSEFKEETGIPMVIVVESLEEVFPKKGSFGSIFSAGPAVIVLIVVVAAAAVWIGKKSKKKES